MNPSLRNGPPFLPQNLTLLNLPVIVRPVEFYKKKNASLISLSLCYKINHKVLGVKEGLFDAFDHPGANDEHLVRDQV